MPEPCAYISMDKIRFANCQFIAASIISYQPAILGISDTLDHIYLIATFPDAGRTYGWQAAFQADPTVSERFCWEDELLPVHEPSFGGPDAMGLRSGNQVEHRGVEISGIATAVSQLAKTTWNWFWVFTFVWSLSAKISMQTSGSQENGGIGTTVYIIINKLCTTKRGRYFWFAWLASARGPWTSQWPGPWDAAPHCCSFRSGG